MLEDVINGLFQRRQNLRAEANHPGIAVLEGEGRKRDDELVEVVRGVKHFHRGADGGFVVVDLSSDLGSEIAVFP